MRIAHEILVINRRGEVTTYPASIRHTRAARTFREIRDANADSDVILRHVTGNVVYHHRPKVYNAPRPLLTA